MFEMKSAVIIAGGLTSMIVVALIISTTYMGVSPSATPQVTSPSAVANTLKTVVGIDQRRKFAFSLEANATESSPTLTNARYTVESEQATTLVITSDGISPSDCWDLQKSALGQSAASIGFTTLTCRNPVSRGEWEIPLP